MARLHELQSKLPAKTKKVGRRIQCSTLPYFLILILVCTTGLGESSDKERPAASGVAHASKAKELRQSKHTIQSANGPDNLALLIYSPENRDRESLQNKEELQSLPEAVVVTLKSALQEADRYQTGLSLTIIDEEDQHEMQGLGPRRKLIKIDPDYTIRIHYSSVSQDQPGVYKVHVTVKVNSNYDKRNDLHSFQFVTEVETDDKRLSPLKPLAWDIVEEIRKHLKLRELPRYKLAIECFLIPSTEQARLSEFIQSARRSVQVTLNSHMKALSVVAKDCNQAEKPGNQPEKPEKDTLLYLFGAITLFHSDLGQFDLDVYRDLTHQNHIAFYTHPKCEKWDSESGWEKGRFAAIELEQQLEGIEFHNKMHSMLKEDGR